MKPTGIILIVLTVLIQLVWYFPIVQEHDTTAIFSQFLGSSALICMAFSQLLATRFKGVELIFGPLDRVYILHKWIAVYAILAAALHDTIDADLDGIGTETWLTDLAETMGELGFYGLLILGMISIITLIPYHFWKWSHRFMGLFYAMASFHYLFILKSFDTFSPLGIYIATFCLIGVSSYLYLLALYARPFNTKSYITQSCYEHHSVIHVNLKPKHKGIVHKPGQFAFISFDVPDFKETHPFTICSAPNNEREIDFAISAAGSFTHGLQSNISPGTAVKISRAFGHFTLPTHSGEQVWIAGGIGITPFIAWLQAMDSDWKTPVTLYYCVSTADQALFIDLLKQTEQKIDSFKFILVVSTTNGRLSAQQIVSNLRSERNSVQVWFCGPKKMREQLRDQLARQDIAASRFHYEEFEIRSGIGIGKFLSWLLKRFDKNV